MQNAQSLLAQYLVNRQIFDVKVIQAIPLLLQQKNAEAFALLDFACKLLPTHPNIVYTQQLTNYASGMMQGQIATTTKKYADAVTAYTTAVNALTPLAAAPVNDRCPRSPLPNSQTTLTMAQQTLLTAITDFDAKYCRKRPGFSSNRIIRTPANGSTTRAEAYPYHPNASQAQILKMYCDAMNQGQLAMNGKNYANAIIAYQNALTSIPMTRLPQRARQRPAIADGDRTGTKKLRARPRRPTRVLARSRSMSKPSSF